MAIVPPTFAPNCGQPHAITAKSATADAARSARPRPSADGRPRPSADGRPRPSADGRPWPSVPAFRPPGSRSEAARSKAGERAWPQQRVAHPGDRDHGADGIQPDPGAADPVEPAALQDGQAERRTQLQPGAGDHVQPDDQDGHRGDGAWRPERIPPPGPGQGDRAHRRRPRDGEPVLPDRRVRHQPPRHQVGQERAGWHRTRDGARDPPQRRPAAPPVRLTAPEEQPDADEHDQVNRDVEPEEDFVCAHPDLGGRVLADEPAQGGASAPRPARVICEPGKPTGRGRPRQPSTVGVRSVSTTIPACRVEGASS